MDFPKPLSERIYIELPDFHVKIATDVRSLNFAVRDAHKDGRAWSWGYYREDAYMCLPMMNPGMAEVIRKRKC
jgi:hypothetical protein